ncbi:MAG: glycosyltransferase family 1 protein [Patescibacteria group bacterium]|nr:glycosyltransferase family 1 protein [Patescibacteria group bacterium]
MRIGIDARCLEEEKISGVGEYALEIIRNLLEIDRENQYIIFSNSYKQTSKNFDFLKKYPNAELKRFRYPNRLLNFCLWYFGRPKLDILIGGVDIFFAPNINFLAVSSPPVKSPPRNLLGNFFTQAFFGVDLARGKDCKLITTFHDLSFERFPEFFTAKTRLWHFYFVNPRRIAQKSDSIVAVSESTKRDMEELYGKNPQILEVVHHGTGADYKIISRNDPRLLDVQKKYNLPYKFVLYLGNIEPRKNVRSLIEAHKKLQKNNPKLEKYKLVLAGNVSLLCRGELEKENIHVIGYIDREDKPFIYNLASLFVYPSHFEGFGLPLLEAMACGTPVISSNNSSIPEVAGNAAIFVDPNRPQEIFEAMRNTLTDEKLFGELRERGLKQSKKFSWKKAARETLKIFHNIHNS